MWSSQVAASMLAMVVTQKKGMLDEKVRLHWQYGLRRCFNADNGGDAKEKNIESESAAVEELIDDDDCHF